MADYQKMYAVLCGAIDDVLDRQSRRHTQRHCRANTTGKGAPE